MGDDVLLTLVDLVVFHRINGMVTLRLDHMFTEFVFTIYICPHQPSSNVFKKVILSLL